ncbi:L,D-transpeptidase family protein [Cereibacter sphaeroides]|uniref:L,D-transpeptidase family protein n=1 Tax=Rhodobacterales TaxID=204455 RepID=UPI000BBED94F|nr:MULTISPECIES: L,D-transpeptidase family protein [Paracoccaceae]MCE6952256.1 L,D-transpeptidase family protein [Cereibacter sphaeroides]MCE6961049.1 L,D-transpeptidase family protein [Cereibacter sphaeroides]MCE6969653.1 L,D-transpeptidase family protein [Cereibacter sphaeroides]MCE6975128.1 L,D-transpeptidase family protein [Cereibacter sphaeroides]
MQFLKITLIVLALALAGCGGDPKIRRYDGPPVTSVQVHKADRKMYLLSGSHVLRQYDIGLGFRPTGHKQYEGDGRTPEGVYFINRQNPRSNYHLSLGISYPNTSDQKMAFLQGKEPGGDIFIHGRGKYRGPNKRDWTAGCIAVSDEEVEEVYSMVRVGTPIYILP